MAKFLYVKKGTIKHCLGNTITSALSNVVKSEKKSYIPVALVVPDDEYSTIYNALSRLTKLTNDDGSFTADYFTLKNTLPEMLDFIYYNNFGNTTTTSEISSLLNVLPNGRDFTSYVTGDYNNAICSVYNYDIVSDIPNMSTVTAGIYQNGNRLTSTQNFSFASGYICRLHIFIFNESITKTCGFSFLPYDDSNRVDLSRSSTNINLNSSDTNIIKTVFKIGDIPTDPYSAGGNSTGNGVGGGGGTGDFDDTSDTITLPSLPSLSGLNTGFFTAFIPSASQMQSVSNYLWNNFLEDIIDPDSTIGKKVDALKKIIANPYDAIMGCSVIPVTPPTAGSKELKMYGLIDTGISIPYASTRWVTVDCGTLNIHEFWGGYLDYSPYTKTTSLYLPYIGTVSIDIDLIMAKALQVVYRVDILSGICVAFILVDGSVKFHYQGQCATQIPITNADYSSVISAGIGLIGSASQVVGSAVAGASTGGPVGAVVGAVGGAVAQAPSVASNVMGAKPDIRSGGSVGSSAGILSVQKPYLIIERPKQSLPEKQNTFTGYPSNITSNVGSLKGYTEFETINLDNLFLTDAEKEELENILKGGVYL